jgi:hypothetical protein
MDTARLNLSTILPALKRARLPIITIALTYLASVLVGIVMVDTGSAFALNTRDIIVKRAYSGSNPTINALQKGNRVQAALTDFASNLILGAVTDTIGGLGVITSYPLIAYRGWVGGIVSVDQFHASRLSQPGEALYYLVTLILQLIPYSLAGGAGVHLGLSYYRLHSDRQVPKWFGLPKAALGDVARIYILVIPLFLVASLWEFLFNI